MKQLESVEQLIGKVVKRASMDERCLVIDLESGETICISLQAYCEDGAYCDLYLEVT
jgi:hypothetical protein